MLPKAKFPVAGLPLCDLVFRVALLNKMVAFVIPLTQEQKVAATSEFDLVSTLAVAEDEPAVFTSCHGCNNENYHGCRHWWYCWSCCIALDENEIQNRTNERTNKQYT